MIVQGEEKKAIMPLLGKLYVSASSSMEKVQNAKDLVAEAIDMNIANDAACRNGLNKFQAAIVKVIGESETDKQAVDEETMAEIGQESKMEVDDAGLPNLELQPDVVKTEPLPDAQDSLLEELLADDDEERQ